MKKFMKVRGFLGALHETSAKTGKGCDQLREAIVQAIDWRSIPETTSPALYHRLKQEILSLRDSGLVLIRLGEFKQRMEMTLRGENFELAELEAVVGLLAGPGMIQRLDFGGFILLRPEVLSRCAAAVVRKGSIRNAPQPSPALRAPSSTPVGEGPPAPTRTNWWPGIWITRISNGCRARRSRWCCAGCWRRSLAELRVCASLAQPGRAKDDSPAMNRCAVVGRP